MHYVKLSESSRKVAYTQELNLFNQKNDPMKVCM